jgi:hypothetical protein
MDRIKRMGQERVLTADFADERRCRNSFVTSASSAVQILILFILYIHVKFS